MRNFVQPGKVLSLAAPAGGVVAGVGYLIGHLFVVADETAAAAATFTGETEGVFSLAKTSGQAWAVGDRVYWDATNGRGDTTASLGPCIGVAVAAAANPSSTGMVRLNGNSAARAVSIEEGSPTPTSHNTAGSVTLTATETLSGILVADPGSADRTYTFPTAALLVAAVPGAKVGDLIRLHVVNGAAGAHNVVLAAGSGGGFDANQNSASQIVAENASKDVCIRLTNVTPSSEAYVIYA